ncbi:MAG: chemotaxis response regulator protein-glutamate methylesterase [Verrucomicrobiae bacterium]|nr:chemotaxis response regulator protein-glutamate methylesterase [Verrucomicrobiae bacterium]
MEKKADSKRKIRVLVTDDSPLMRQFLSGVIEATPEFSLVGVAANGEEALKLIPELKPDVVTMDIAMPVLDGLEATQQIMARHPTPILIVSASHAKEATGLAFKALAYGALDVFDKSFATAAEGREVKIAEFIARIKIVSRVRVIRHPFAKAGTAPIRMAVPEKPASSERAPAGMLVAIAASTGGPHALQEILRELPADFPSSILIVQHISEGFDVGLADWLGHQCSIAVKLASDGLTIQAGTAYLAPTGSHLRIGKNRKLALTDEPAQDGYKPSANLLFESVARVYRERALGVILSGMGGDGVVGLREMKRAGARIFAQDEATSIVFGMPKAAVEAGIVDSVLALDRIAAAILESAARD